MLEGQAVAEEVQRRLVEASENGWEMLRITSSFLAVGEEEDAVGRQDGGSGMSYGRQSAHLVEPSLTRR